MNGILLTQNTTPIFRYIVWVLGKIMEGIFVVINAIGIPNIGLAIILFTIVVNLLMLPMTIKQQKFSKLQNKISPELQVIQEKYKNKKDQESQLAMQQETQAIYAKYGISPTGGCGYLLLQMPILFALYRVIYAMPAYVGRIGNTFRVLATEIISKDNAAWLQASGSETIQRTVDMYGKSIVNGSVENGIIDVLNRLSSSDLAEVASHYNLNNLEFQGKLILSNGTTRGLIDTYNNFLGLNIGDSPKALMTEAFHNGAWLLMIGAVMIPVLSAVTQWINTKLMPQQDTKDMSEQAAQMQSSMKTMNMIMPLMSAWFCFTLPAGMGLYWVAGSVVRSIQQVIINKHIDKMDFDKIIAQNSEKSAKKMEKLKQNQEKINAYANMNTRNIKTMQEKANISSNSNNIEKNSDNTVKTSSVKSAKPGSMMAKANMVSEFNKKSNK